MEEWDYLIELGSRNPLFQACPVDAGKGDGECERKDKIGSRQRTPKHDEPVSTLRLDRNWERPHSIYKAGKKPLQAVQCALRKNEDWSSLYKDLSHCCDWREKCAPIPIVLARHFQPVTLHNLRCVNLPLATETRFSVDCGE